MNTLAWIIVVVFLFGQVYSILKTAMDAARRIGSGAATWATMIGFGFYVCVAWALNHLFVLR